MFSIIDDFHQIKAFAYIITYVLNTAIAPCTMQDTLFLFRSKVGSRQIIIQFAAGFDFGKDQCFAVKQYYIQPASCGL